MSKPIKHYGKWRIRWVDENNQHRSETHDTYKDAAFALARHETQAEEIRRRLRPSLSLNKTFNDLCDYYLEHRSSLKRRARDDESIIRVHLRPFFGKFELSNISDHIDEFRSARKHIHKSTLHHQLTLLISMLRVGHGKRWLIELPKIEKPKLRIFNKDFSYLKTNEEIHRFLRAAEDEGENILTIYAFSLYTGVRPGELAGLLKGDVALDRRLITIQRSYSGPTKNGEVRYVPILDPLLPLLQKWMIRNSNQILFPNQAGKMLGEGARVFNDVFYRVIDRAGFPVIERNGKTCRYIRYYDLRHTFASHWMKSGGDLFKLSKIMGHNTVQMTMRYAHLCPDAFINDYHRITAFSPTTQAQIIELNPRP